MEMGQAMLCGLRQAQAERKLRIILIPAQAELVEGHAPTFGLDHD